MANNIKSASSNKLFSMATAACGASSGRKLSTKEKGKRQKDAERIEKLRLLVSYLKSGTSQPVLSPVTLEADEIELAERYKLHMLIRDQELFNGNGGDGGGGGVGFNEPNGFKSANHHLMLNGLTNGATGGVAKLASSFSSNHMQLLEAANNGLVAGGGLAINGSGGGFGGGGGGSNGINQGQKLKQQQASSAQNLTISSCTTRHQQQAISASPSSMAMATKHPSVATTTDTRTTTATSSSCQLGPTSHSAASSSSSMHEAHSTNDGGRSSIPHIGTISWALRHSISDPGTNQFERHHNGSSPVFSHHVRNNHNHSHNHHNYHYHDHSDQNYHNHLSHHNHHNNHPNHDLHQLVDQTNDQNHNNGRSNIHLGCESDGCGPCCAVPSGTPSSSYSSSISAIGIGASGNLVLTTNNTNPTSSSLSNGCNQQLLAFKQQQPCSINQSPKLFYIDDLELQNHSPISPLTSIGTCDTIACSSSLSQPTTPAITNSSTCDSVIDGEATVKTTPPLTTRSSSAWTNPQNLATWIDNEVNSLVHDLESKSSQLNIKSEKPAKSGKRRWLSVSGRGRRNSSGAHSS